MYRSLQDAFITTVLFLIVSIKAQKRGMLSILFMHLTFFKYKEFFFRLNKMLLNYLSIMNKYTDSFDLPIHSDISKMFVLHSIKSLRKLKFAL